LATDNPSIVVIGFAKTVPQIPSHNVVRAI
jgi:hypothetical protein